MRPIPKDKPVTDRQRQAQLRNQGACADSLAAYLRQCGENVPYARWRDSNIEDDQ